MQHAKDYIDAIALTLDAIAAIGLYQYKFKPLKKLENNYRIELMVAHPQEYDAKRHIESVIEEINDKMDKRDALNKKNDEKAGTYFRVLIVALIAHAFSISVAFMDSPTSNTPANESSCNQSHNCNR